MQLHQLPKLGRKRKTIGRGIGSRGAKSGRGMKGQKSRAGYSRKAGFEGGQTPLYMRFPKGRGTKQKFPSQVKRPTVISLSLLNRFAAGAIVGPGVLRKAGFLPDGAAQVKLIRGKLQKKLTVRVHKISAGAQKTIEELGGKVEIIK